MLSSTAIAAGDTQTRNFCDDDVDWLSFTPSSSGMYVMNTTRLAFISPYQQDGITPAPTHDTYFYSKFSLDAAANTTYYLRATGSGAYQVTVFQCTPDAYEDDETSAGARAIGVSETQKRNNCEDRV